MILSKAIKGVILLISYPIYLLSIIFPSKKNNWLFGSFGNFNDNSRYLFEYCVNNESNIKCCWVAKSKAEFSFVKKQGLPVVYKYSINGLYKLLSSRVYIYSSYVSNISYFTSANKILVNLWHGIPLKKVEFDISTPPLNKLFSDATSLTKFLYPQLHKRENLLLCPSTYLFHNIFKTAFNKKQDNIIYANYPRFTYIEEKILNYKKNKNATKSIITYTPTWRDNDPHFLEKKLDLFSKINELAKLKNFEFNIKPHSNSIVNAESLKQFNNINIVDSKVDPIDLLLSTDCLITDYSSIYLDYLFMDKPIIFFQYDIESYLKNRELYDCDINKLPGYLCHSDDELIYILSSEINVNTHRKQRSNLIDIISSNNKNAFIISQIKNYQP